MTQFIKDCRHTSNRILFNRILWLILSQALLKSSKKTRIELLLPCVFENQQWNMLIIAPTIEEVFNGVYLGITMT